ncbi:NUDIX domain-containing protein [Halogeometricum borinquense]|uniref:ADP-ribose pyrophosphatase n=2 Tax=Halogeometricum borinquense TaxID=60847 RepID=E4NTB4_HALBP|nr:NUDIX domain-containing protein [Halogeometricum borinquense]ADQ68211.1 ADP-ribose pyrophosphatase [Halogeometricum borinquense DSM 11551]ELY24745.1 ADP-ribose pyrophosphatase [Halogeometricum borinquense DSM 11551]QIB73207.1 NUDIX domain-containing protein [Halogeometricum borinquense]QIQ77397.1 NUDIX domain-containing protein [Halogeometricum borinquense]RYJ12893.1 NUDIX domain-containing protein [Halogeometricum borinquense]
MTEKPLRATVSLRGVLFAPDGDVLVVRRTTDEGWELPGGRLGAYEDASEGVQREIAEETGLNVELGQPVHAIAWRNDDDDGRFGVYYYGTVTEQTVSLSHEHIEYEWVSPQSAEDRLSEPQATAVNNASEVREE